MRHLPLLPLALFVATYLGLATGRIPRLALDRTGCALLGAIAFLVSGTLDLGQAAASVDTAAWHQSARHRRSRPGRACGRVVRGDGAGQLSPRRSRPAMRGDLSA